MRLNGSAAPIGGTDAAAAMASAAEGLAPVAAVASAFVMNGVVEVRGAKSSPETLITAMALGKQIGKVCGELIRPCVLELGGKSAAIVLDDADLDLAKIGNDLFAATLLNNGQICCGLKRLIVT